MPVQVGLFEVDDNLSSPTVLIVDFDNEISPLVGPAITEAVTTARD